MQMERQLRLEQNMLDYGVARLKYSSKRDTQSGRADETMYAKRLLKHHLEPLVSATHLYVQGLNKVGRGAKYAVMLRLLPAETLAMIAMKTALSLTAMHDDQVALTSVAGSIGERIEDEVRFNRFKEQHPKYVSDLLKDFKRKGTQNYRYMHRVLTHMANKIGDGWSSWSRADKVSIGTTMFNLVSEVTGLVQATKVQQYRRGKSQYICVMTDEAKQWVQGYIEHIGSFLPVRAPCIIPPDDWSDLYNGGYYMPELRSSTPFTKPKFSYLTKQYNAAVEHAPMIQPRRAASALQRTQWEVNTEVLDVMETVWRNNLGCGIPGGTPYVAPASPFPRELAPKDMTPEQQELFQQWKHEAAEVHRAERMRAVHSSQFVSTLRRAKDYAKEDGLYFVYSACFRGRLYTTTTDLSPQGGAESRGLLRFANGMELGAGEDWWWIHGANTFGKDKISYTDRVAFAQSEVDTWCQIATDPIGTRGIWSSADKPWQFLAWCFEVREHCNGSLKSKLPIGLDGSCNGLQHFSAMLRDPIGGAATNLIDAETPADIYGRVADVLMQKLQLMPSEALAQMWMRFGINRKLVKKPVMTLPYGSTQHSCIRSLLASTDEQKGFFDNPFRACLWLTPLLWDSIGEVVVAARAAMDWLKQVGSIASGEESPLTWTNPAGFPVWQWYNKCTVSRIKSMLMGTQVQLNVAKPTEYADTSRMKAGTSPNFVHSCDAAHMVMTVNAAQDWGIHDFACIHDDYGTHACNTPAFSKIIREQFYTLYTEHDVLGDFKREVERSGLLLPALPERGSLDIKEVLTSRYFFG